MLFIPSWYKQTDNPLLGNFFFEQARVLSRNGFTVGLVYTEKKKTPLIRCLPHFLDTASFRDFDDDGVRTLRIKGLFPPFLLLSHHLWVRSVLFLFREYVKRYGRPEVVHVQSVLFGGPVGRLIEKNFGIPYLICEHASFIGLSDIEPWKKRIACAAFSHAASVLAVGNRLAKDIEQEYEVRKVEVVPNFVDTAFFHRPFAPSKTSPFVFLTVCNLVPVKNLELLISAFKEVADANAQVVLRIAGQGDLREALEALVSKLGLMDKVTFLGALSRSEVRGAMWDANVYMLTSRYETFGIAAAEAMATGLKVISTKCGGPEDIVASGLGVTVQEGDKSALARAMTEAAREIVEPEEAPNERRDYIAHNFGETAFCRNVRRQYDLVIQKSGRGG